MASVIMVMSGFKLCVLYILGMGYVLSFADGVKDDLMGKGILLECYAWA